LALDHSGTIASNETWLAADNPHNVISTVTVSAGVTLTIEAGAEVYFNASQRLDISGVLTAVGAPGQEILFTNNGGNNWSYPRFLTAGSGTFDYCTIENSTLQNSTYAIYSTATAAISVSDCLLQNNTRGYYGTGGTVDLASTTFTGNSAHGFYGAGVAPNLLDANVVFTDNGTGVRVDNVAGATFTTTMNVTGSTTVGVHLDGCDGPNIDNQVLTGNTGTHGALLLDDCGEFALGAGNTIGGSGLENSWPLTIGAGSYPSVGGVIPTSGNTNNDIQVNGGASARTGTWRKFADLDYIVTGTTTISAGGELTVAPGVNLRFDAGRFDISGVLNAVGAPGQEILFTNNGGNNWSYPRFLTAGSGTFDYCTIENTALAGRSRSCAARSSTTPPTEYIWLAQRRPSGNL